MLKQLEVGTGILVQHEVHRHKNGRRQKARGQASTQVVFHWRATCIFDYDDCIWEIRPTKTSSLR